jgi:hypothetical protein
VIIIPPLRTRRISARIREITAGAAIRLAGIHPARHEHATTEFLRAIIESADTPTPRHVADPLLWTVQERTLAVCHYIAASAPNGGADFAIGDAGRLTNYMMTDKDYVPDFDLGQACEDRWRMVPMTGMAAEAIERTNGNIPNVAAGRLHWLVGSMAAQMIRVDESSQPIDEPAPLDVVAYDEWLEARMAVMIGFPASDFEVMLSMRARGADGLTHLFDMDVSHEGMVAYPRETEGGLAPARFPVDECIPPVAKGLAQPLQELDS